jgi:hypothetical protein
MELRDQLRVVNIPDGAAGKTRPLVKSERVLFRSTRPPMPETPPNRLGLFALVGILIGGALALLGWRALSRRWARVALGAGSAVLGLVFGLLGTALVFLWTVTDHRVAHGNTNVLQSVPWALALLVYGIKVALGRAGAARKAFWIAAAAVAASLLGLLGKLVGLLWQDNAPWIAFFFPIWLGLALGLALFVGIRLPLRRPAVR